MAGIPNRLPFTDRGNGQNAPRLTRTRRFSELRTRPDQGPAHQLGTQPSGTLPINQDRFLHNTFIPTFARADAATDIGIEPLPRPRVGASDRQLVRVPENRNITVAFPPPLTPITDQFNTFGAFTLAPPPAPRKGKPEHSVSDTSQLQTATQEVGFPRSHPNFNNDRFDRILQPSHEETRDFDRSLSPQNNAGRDTFSQPGPLHAQYGGGITHSTSAFNKNNKNDNQSLIIPSNRNRRSKKMSEYFIPPPAALAQSAFGAYEFNVPPGITSESLHKFDIEGVPPFIDLTRFAGGNNRNVLKIKNIPYTLTIPEVRQFVHKNLFPPGQGSENGIYDIHIIMERATGKTLDCFVELDVPHLLYIAVDKYHAMIDIGQHPKMGNRQVSVHNSSQGELMQQIFPRAKAVYWDGASGMPTIVYAGDKFSEGFRGFLTGEELTNMVRHAEFPQRSQFSSRCLQRTFECMISTLAKFPWFTTYYTVQARDKLFHAYNAQLRILVYKTVPEFGHNERNMREVGLDMRLLNGFINAGLTCPGFSERQKHIIGNIVPLPNPITNPLGNLWPFSTLGKPANVSDQDVGQWLDLLASGIMKAQQDNKPLRLEPYLIVEYNGQGQAAICASEVAFNDSYVNLAHMETHLMKLILEQGWEVWFAERGIPYQARDIQFQPLGIENQFRDLALQHRPNVQTDGGASPMPSDFEVNPMRYLLKGSLPEVPEVSAKKHNSVEPENMIAPDDTRLGSGLADIPRIVDGQFRSQLHQQNLVRRFNPETPEFAPGPTIEHQPGIAGIGGSAFHTTASTKWAPGLRGSAGRVQNSDDKFEYSFTTQADGQRIMNIKRSPEKNKDSDEPLSPPSHGSNLSSNNSHSGVESSINKSISENVHLDQPVIGTPAKRVKARNPLNIDFTIHEDAEDEGDPSNNADVSAHGRRR